jgi:thiol-disulfide isomerase/thioredoxin
VALLVLAATAGFGLYMILVPVGHDLEAGIDPDAGLGLVSAFLDKPADDLAFLQVADNAPRALRELRGKVVVLNLWATWCQPCREELPALNRLQSTYADRGLQVVTVSDETPAPLRKFAAQHPFQTLNVYTSRLGWFDVPVRPVILVIDRQGNVRRAVIGGPRRYEELAEWIRPYIVTG